MTYVPDRVGIAMWVTSGDQTGGPATPISAQAPGPAAAGMIRLPVGRGRGVTVAGTPQRGEVVARAREFVRFAREQGYRAEELVRIIEDLA